MVYHIKAQNVNNVVCIAKITVICGKRFVVIKTVIVLAVLLLIATFSYICIFWSTRFWNNLNNKNNYIIKETGNECWILLEWFRA